LSENLQISKDSKETDYLKKSPPTTSEAYIPIFKTRNFKDIYIEVALRRGNIRGRKPVLVQQSTNIRMVNLSKNFVLDKVKWK
jgi:hypothetical protein